MRELQNEYLLAKIGADTAEKGPNLIEFLQHFWQHLVCLAVGQPQCAGGTASTAGARST